MGTVTRHTRARAILPEGIVISEETSTMHKVIKIQLRKSDKHIVIEWEEI